MTELKKLFNLAAENAARIFNSDGEVLPMWHAVTGNDEHVLIATPWSKGGRLQRHVRPHGRHAHVIPLE